MTSKERESSFRELFERNQGRWTGIARAYADSGEREDLLQEIMMQVWKSMDGFEGRSSLDTWAYRIALNTALAWDRTARKRANIKTSPTDVGHLPGESESDAFETRVLDEFLASLSKTDRAVMLLFLDDVPYPKAAEISGMTEGTLRVRLHRIRQRFEEAYCDGKPDHDV